MIITRWQVPILMVALAAGSALGGAKSATIKDCLGVDWQDELVHWDIELPAGELKEPAALVTADGQATPSQISEVTRHDDGSVRSMKVWVMASIPSNGAVTYAIEPGKPAPAVKGAAADASSRRIDLTTGAAQPIAIRLPAGSRTYKTPVPAADVPGPLQALRLPSGQWVGNGRFSVPFKVNSYEAKVLASGPLFAEARVKYVFDVGYWTFKARVIRGCPMIVIEEELDTGASGQAWDKLDRYYVFTVNTKGFAPEQAFFSTLAAPQGTKGDRYCDLVNVSNPNWLRMEMFGYRLKFDEDRDDLFLPSWPTFYARQSNHMRFVQPGRNTIGLATLNTGYWRHPMSVRVGTATRGKELQIKLPLQMYRQNDASDGYDPQSPNYTGITLGVPENTSRRSYGIMLSPAEDEQKERLGSLIRLTAKIGGSPSLDVVKDWVLDWPDPLASAKWPERSSTEATNVLAKMRDYVTFMRTQGDYGAFCQNSYSRYHGRGTLARTVMPEWQDGKFVLSPADRATLRRLCAYQAYVTATPGYLPWGVGCHLGTLNMPLQAKAGQAVATTLIDDHPLFQSWGKDCLAFCTDYFQRLARPSGAWRECPHYVLGAELGQLNTIDYCLGRKTNIGGLFQDDLAEKAFRFLLDWLTPPDVRFSRYRVVLPVGNTSYQSVAQWVLDSAILRFFEAGKKDLAGQLQWAVNQTEPAIRRHPKAPEVAPDLRSCSYPGFGVFFRHGFGTSNETYLAMMAGDCVNHYEWDTDQMSYTLYAKGHPINLHFGNGYFPMLGRPWLRNRVSFDMKIEPSERIVSKVESTAFSPAADYLRASRDVDQLRALYNELPDLQENCEWSAVEQKNWPSTSDALPPVETIPLTTWHRQMLFLKDADPKGPNYFVLRDSFAGQPTRPTDLSLWFLANKMEPQANYYHFDGQCPVDMDVFVVSPAGGEPRTGTYGHKNQPYIRDVPSDPAYYPHGQDKTATNLPYGRLAEEQLLFRLHQPAGQGYCVVLYPRLKHDDPPAAFAALAENAVKVETPLSEDYVFVDSKAMEYKDEKVSFAGQAGAVRFYKTGRTEIVNTEGKASVKMAGKTVSGEGAFVVTLADGKVESKTFSAGARVKVE